MFTEFIATDDGDDRHDVGKRLRNALLVESVLDHRKNHH